MTPLPSSDPPRRPDPALLSDLRRRIRRLEGHGGAMAGEDGTPGVLSLGVPAVDGALPWGGLPRAGLHEVLGGGRGDGAADGFCAALLARLAAGGAPVLWVRRGGDLYGPGLAAFGLGPERLIVVRGRTATDVLWAMEEALRSGVPAAVLGEAEGASPTALRRLQLAAESGGTMALVLRPGAADAAASPALTRWRVTAAPADAGVFAAPRWRLELVRCRGGTPAAWLMEWHHGADAARRRSGSENRGRGGARPAFEGARHETGGLVVAADLGHRPAAPATGRDGTRPAAGA